MIFSHRRKIAEGGRMEAEVIYSILEIGKTFMNYQIKRWIKKEKKRKKERTEREIIHLGQVGILVKR